MNIYSNDFRGDVLFSMEDASGYLKCSVSLLRRHLLGKTQAPLYGERIAGRWIFRKSELDRWNSTRRPPGRPKGSKSKANSELAKMLHDLETSRQAVLSGLVGAR